MDASPSPLLGPDTVTSRDQRKTENDVVTCFKTFLSSEKAQTEGIMLNREQHKQWLERGLVSLSPNFAGLNASRPWFCFWISHALDLLGVFDEDHWAPKMASFLAHCQHEGGGVGGGPTQLAHLAPTYAATAALIVSGQEVAYRGLDRQKLYAFLMRMKAPEGGFRMHDEGECDMRGTYCALASASMLHLITDELIEGVDDYVRRCQTWEGGIAGEEGLEAHGGYSYCGLAALCIIGRSHVLDLRAFLNWAIHRQMSLEGGFQGRTNKLVDSCYSFWQGAIFPLLHEAFLQQDGAAKPLLVPDKHVWFAPSPLQTYVFLACQHPNGGLRDKPGKAADFYHTCYSLSGVSAAQHLQDDVSVLGSEKNELARTNVFYNVLEQKALRKCAYFDSMPPFTYEGREVHGREGVGVVRARERSLAAQP
mmetsp:Transcript_19002/g.42523  ORF Transcript_19002/g.42523 Transcript_19002/m.42523 type:complete len:422 (+) Transcript_19002:48-1313(+)